MANQKGKEVKISLYKASIEPLAKAKEIEVAKKMASGSKKARDLLICANIRYALSEARKYYGLGLSSEEVNTEAVIGLIKAVDRFDSTWNTRVITFAKKYIMNEIIMARNKSGYVLRQSNERLKMIRKINEAKRETNAEYNHAEFINFLSENTGLKIELICELLQAEEPCVSLDEEMPDSGETRLSMIPDTASCSTEETAIYHIQKQALYASIKKLEPIERDIICMHYGFNGYKEEYSLAEIGEKYQKSRQCIFSIKERALRKLKENMNSLAA